MIVLRVLKCKMLPPPCRVRRAYRNLFACLVKIFLRLNFLLLLGLASACASNWQAYWPASSPERALALADRHHYVSALAVADRGLSRAGDDRELDNWRETRSAIESRAESYARESAREIDQLVMQDDWDNALERMDFFAKHLPANEENTRLLQSWVKSRNEQQSTLESAWLLLMSRQIPEALALAEKRVAISPDAKAPRRELNWLQKQSSDAYSALFVRFSEAEAQGAPDSALLYARALHRLQPSDQVSEAITRLQAAQAVAVASTPQQTQAANAAETTQYQGLLNEYGNALVNERWRDARATLDQLLAMRPREAELLGQDKHLKEIFQREIDAARSEGEQLYSAGEVEAALEAWRRAQELAGDDPQLQANIERAQRILDKVRALTNESETETETESATDQGE